MAATTPKIPAHDNAGNGVAKSKFAVRDIAVDKAINTSSVA